jgi:hypothetical protein
MDVISRMCECEQEKILLLYLCMFKKKKLTNFVDAENIF